MMPLIVLALVIVAVAVLSPRFAADSRPGVADPQQAWFGRR
jgi:hypothetical protein